MQRLFSTFANGWPGAGLLLQRVLSGVVLFYLGFSEIFARTGGEPVIPQIIGAAAGLFLVVGLWTPFAGTLVTVVEIWAALRSTPEPWVHIIISTLGATLAMIGPGAWSIDAHLYGRKHIETRYTRQK